MNYASVAGQQILVTKPKTKKKKTPKNAFGFFLDDATKELRRNGQNVSHKGEALSYASEKWKNMNAEEKLVYEEKAKAWKVQNKQQSRPGRLDCTGQPIDFRIDMEDLTEKERRQARKFLRSQWPAGKGVCDVHFYFISFQSLFELPDEEGYQPCEVACIDYTLNRGIERVWHHFIDPGPIKLGMRAEIKIFAEKTHRIPEEGFDRANDQHRMIWDELIRFVNPNSSSTLPPVFCKISEKRKTLFCLEWLSAFAGVSNRLGKVYEIEDLAAELFDHSGIMRPSLSTIEDGCNSHMYDFEANTTCEYHEEIECVHCALLTINKCCYWMSDSLQQAYGFEITDQHLPVRKTLNFTITAPDPREVEDFQGHRRYDRNRPNPLASRRNDNHEYVQRADDRFNSRARQPAMPDYVSRDIRYRPRFDVVPATTQCATEVEDFRPPAQSHAPTSSAPHTLSESGDQTPRMQFLGGNKPSTGLSRRPVSNPQFANKQAGTMAANFQVKAKAWPPSGASSSGDGIDRLSQDFDGSVSVSSSGLSEADEETTKPRIAMLGRGRGRGRGQFR